MQIKMQIENKLKLSDQAIGSLMMALQKGLLEQADITEMLREFELSNTNEGLVVNNPPTVKVSDAEVVKDA
tara:strand:+ start:143 stop:355 length:213 start_codon:yes stop_codon:yes gene_type:complete